MTDDSLRSNRIAGAVCAAIGLIAVIGYTVFGATPESPDLPAGRLVLAAVLVIVGLALRHRAAPTWAQFAAGLLAGLVAYDLLNALLG